MFNLLCRFLIMLLVDLLNIGMLTLCVSLTSCISVYQTIYLSISLSILISICLYVCLYLSLPVFTHSLYFSKEQKWWKDFFTLDRYHTNIPTQRQTVFKTFLNFNNIHQQWQSHFFCLLHLSKNKIPELKESWFIPLYFIDMYGILWSV